MGIEVCDVYRSFTVGSQTVHALAGISLRVEPRSLIIFRGRSGSGKTTLLNLLGGLDTPTSGQIYYDGRNLQNFTEPELTEWRKSKIGFVFQTFVLIPHLTAFENVALPMRFNKTPWKERDERARECLKMVGLSKRANHMAMELSGGEQQRVAVARALVNRPSIILADEPTGSLDFETGMKVMELFREIVNNNGVTICVATHDSAVSEFGDSRIFIEDGRISEEA